MSLTDALLLDPHRDRKEIWIALPRDGIRGSGTQVDPYNGSALLTNQVTGSVAFDPLDVIALADMPHEYATDSLHPIKISGAGTVAASLFNSTSGHSITRLNDFAFSFVLPGSPLALDHPPLRGILMNVSAQKGSDPVKGVELHWPILKVRTDAAHGFADREVIRLTGASDSVLNGDFMIFCLSPTTFAIWPNRVPFRPDSGELGEVTCGRSVFLFDQVMRAAPDGAAIHIGPGVFETRGLPSGVTETSHPVFFNWRPQSGQRITGAAMGATTLKLVGASIRNKTYIVIQTWDAFQFLDGLEISDLTIDCNTEGQPIRLVAPGAIALVSGGRHLRIRRVRAINFGSQSEAHNYEENFLFSAGAPLGLPEGISRNCVFEDCVAESPAHNGHHNSFCFTIGSGEHDFGDGVTHYPRGCAIRNCYVNMASHFGPCVPIESLNYNLQSGAVTVVTRRPHGRMFPDNVLIQGVAANGQFHNLFNGVFEIVSVSSPTSLVYQGPKAADLVPPPALVTLVGGTLGGRLPVRQVSLEARPGFVEGIAKINPGDPNDLRYRLTTREPHRRTRNNNVRILGVVDKAPDPADPLKFVTVPHPFDGVFAVDAYDPAKPYELEFTLLTPRNPTATLLLLSGTSVNVHSVGLGVEPGTAMVAEGNRILHTTVGGPYQDTFTSRDIVARNNYYHDVGVGPAEARGLFSSSAGVTPLDSTVTEAPPIDSRLHPLGSGDPANKIAVATTKRPHGLIPDDAVVIDGNTTNQAVKYNGAFTVVDVPNAKIFRYGTSVELPAYGDSTAGYGIGRRPLESLVKALLPGASKWRITGKMVAVGTSQKHGLEKGDAFLIQRAGVLTETSTSKYNGYFKVVAATDDEFKFDMDDAPLYDSSSHADTFSPGYFTKAWGPKRITYENNVIELHQRVVYPDTAQIAIQTTITQGLPDGFFYIGPAIIRNNIIRRIDNDSPADSTYYGILLMNCESAVVHGNVIRLPGESNLIRHVLCGKIRTSSNVTLAGHLILARHFGSGPAAPDSETDVEDAMILALLRH